MHVIKGQSGGGVGLRFFRNFKAMEISGYRPVIE